MSIVSSKDFDFEASKAKDKDFNIISHDILVTLQEDKKYHLSADADELSHIINAVKYYNRKLLNNRINYHKRIAKGARTRARVSNDLKCYELVLPK